MFIQTESTSDPATMRFHPGRSVSATRTVTFDDAAAAAGSPLAARLFALEGVAAVTVAPDHVAVTKTADADWATLKPDVLRAVMEHFVEGAPVFADEAAAPATDGGGDEDGEIGAEIRELIETRIRPAVEQSGGAIAFAGFEGGVVIVELEGPAVGFKQPIENMLRHYVPEVSGLRTREEHERLQSPEMNTAEALAVRRLLDEEVNPAVASHGGHIALIDISDETVYIRLEGGCQGCGMADVTLKQGVEVAIKRAVPSIAQVLDVTDHAGGTNPYYQPGKGGVSPV